MPETLFDKVWNRHVVTPETIDTPGVLYVDLHLVHEVTSPQAFSEIEARGLTVRRPDRTFATLIEDLNQRGLLDETLVVAMGEFGRTPTHNANGGRDHWGSVFSVALAGAGLDGGQVIGASDRLGAQPQDRPVRPADLAATIFHLLGLEPGTEFLDGLQRPRRLTEGGSALKELIGV